MKYLVKLLLLLTLSLFLVSCANTKQINPKGSNEIKSQQSQQPVVKTIVRAKKPNSSCNEMGKIMVIMYHQIAGKENNEWTRSFDNFRKDLQVLYDKGYRPINLRDYVNGNIEVPSGFTPVIFTFDDGTSGQFNLVEKNGKLVANPKSAVGIMEEFSKIHPDFPLKGTFFINYTGFFHGEGTPQERLKYLISEGFEIGNHTVNHANLNKIITAQGVESEIGGHVKKTQELIPGYTVDELALPLGITSKKFKNYIVKGEFEGTKYENKVVLLVGSNPALSPVDKNINVLSLPRVRATAFKPVQYDLYYWLNYFDKNTKEKYISDGDKDSFTVPAKFEEKINANNEKKIVLQK